jgi:hypothetical protein
MTRSAQLPRTTLFLLALGAFVTTACGGGSHQLLRTPDRGAPEPLTGGALEESAAPSDAYPAPAASPPSAGAAAPSASRSEASGAAADRAYEPSPKKERPGLGTEWGETRESRVSSAPFERADWTRPVSVSSFFYNDEGGVRALPGSGYSERRTDGISAARGALSVRLVDESGAPLPTFASAGRSYVLGNDGAHYAIRIENQTGARFEVVTTVDGLDVIDGEAGSYEKRGYLVGPWSTVEIDGFRRSNEAVAAFRFGRVQDSYAAKRGSDRNVGVIGVAVFQERGSSFPWNERELERRHSADAFPGRFAPPPPSY